ncbi:MAG: hypothetical protein ABH803_00745 [Candidatus Micrarchaeota archaeon]
MKEMIPGVKQETQETAALLKGHSLVTVEVDKGTPPFLRQQKRGKYLEEYFNWEKDGYKNSFKAIFYFVLGIITLGAFPPGGLLMIAMAARYQDTAWFDRHIARRFGDSRSLVLVD